MTITRVAGQGGGVSIDNATSGTKAFASNITSGNRIVVALSAYSPSADLPAVGDCTKSAGTATIGSFTLDVVTDRDAGGGVHFYTAIWSAQVTGTGSCTIQVAGRPAASYFLIGIQEYNSNLGNVIVAGATGNSGINTAADSGNLSSQGNGVFFGVMQYSSGGLITITPDAAFSQVYEEEDGSLHSTGSFIDRIVSTAITDSASWTAPTNDDWAASVVLYVEQRKGIPFLKRTDYLWRRKQ